MRPKLLSLLAASALALVGCSSGEPTVTVAATPSASTESSSPAPTAVSDLTLDTDEKTKAEVIFVEFAQTPLSLADAGPVDREDLITALHDFCDSGKRIRFTTDELSNKNIENIARTSCDKLTD